MKHTIITLAIISVITLFFYNSRPPTFDGYLLSKKHGELAVTCAPIRTDFYCERR